MVEELYHGDQGEGTLSIKALWEPESLIRYKGEGESGTPPKPTSSPSPSSNAIEHSSHGKKNSKNSSHSHDFPLLKLDVKFDFLFMIKSGM